jgi:GABA permease
MAFNADARSQLILSLLAGCLACLVCRHQAAARQAFDRGGGADRGGARVLVLANETVEGAELLDELRAVDRAGKAEYFVCVPANPIDTGQAMHKGAVYMSDATVQAAQDRLDRTLAILRSEQLSVSGELGDYRPLRALAHAVESFRPDRLVICTHPEERSAWLRDDVVIARGQPARSVTHIVVSPPHWPYIRPRLRVGAGGYGSDQRLRGRSTSTSPSRAGPA